MKTLTKLALVSAMAISANAMAAQLQSLDDEALSQATGKDGLTIHLTGGVSFDQLAIHDGDGYNALTAPTTPARADLGFAATADSGAIVLGKNSAGTGAAVALATTNGLDIVVDAEGGATPVLNVNMDFGNTTLDIGDVWVADTTFDGTTAAAGSAANVATATLANDTSALNIGSITLDGLAVNLQLGNQPQGALIKVDSTITNGVIIDSLALNSNANAGTPDGTWANRDSTALTLGALTVRSAGATDLALNLLVDATSEGLFISGLTNLDVFADSVDLGSGTSIGALSIKNLSVGDVIINGH